MICQLDLTGPLQIKQGREYVSTLVITNCSNEKNHLSSVLMLFLHRPGSLFSRQVKSLFLGDGLK